MKRRRLFVLFALALVAALLPSQASAAPSVTVVASGLDSPRGIAFYHGKMLVAEAGHGGTNCFAVPIAGGEACVGNTSAISWVNAQTGARTPLATGLYSLSLGAEGTLGVSGLSVSGGRIIAQIGGTPREDPTALGQAQAGRLIRVNTDGSWSSIAPIGTIDFDSTTSFPEPNPAVCGSCPGTQEHDSNPYGVLATGHSALVADAGSNTLDAIDEDGHVTILFRDGWRDPNPATAFPTDAVPTCVARGGDGLWVGELSGRLLKVEGSTFTPVVLKDSAGNSLLTHVTGCAADDAGNIYFVNMFGPGPVFTPPPASRFFIGDVVRFNTQTGAATVLAGNLMFPNMASIGPDGNLYVTTGSICGSTPVPAPPCFGATGKIIKIALRQASD